MKLLFNYFPFPEEMHFLLFNMVDSLIQCSKLSMKLKNKRALIIIYPEQHKGFDIARSL